MLCNLIRRDPSLCVCLCFLFSFVLSFRFVLVFFCAKFSTLSLILNRSIRRSKGEEDTSADYFIKTNKKGQEKEKEKETRQTKRIYCTKQTNIKEVMKKKK